MSETLDTSVPDEEEEEAQNSERAGPPRPEDEEEEEEEEDEEEEDEEEEEGELLPTGGKPSRNKRGLEEAAGSEYTNKEPRLDARDVMQLRVLANVPLLQGPMRDARGRRRAVCLSTEELIDAGLSAVVGDAVVLGERPPAAAATAATTAITATTDAAVDGGGAHSVGEPESTT